MAMDGFAEGPFNWGLGPGMWWALDRSWIVVSDTDLQISYVGCSVRHADAMLDSDIECAVVERATPITWQ